MEKTDACRRCRVGRYAIDGADFAWIASRLDTSTEQVKEDWAVCRELLSKHLCRASGEEFRLLETNEICERSELCIRLLLDWQQSALNSELVKGFSAHCDGEGDEVN